MESPQTSKTKINSGGTPLSKVNCTPTNHKSSGIAGYEFGLYNPNRESSPSFRAGQEVLEVGWGDSPEPLNVERQFNPKKTCKKKLETKESPKSSIPPKRRNIRSTFSLPSNSIIDVSKYVAEVQELSKNIMKELNASKINQSDDKTDMKYSPTQNTSSNSDPAFDSIIQSFINEEDDWLSQALSTQEQKTPNKGNFVKSKSENELTIPQTDKQQIRNINNNFRRTSSFDMTKPYSNQYSVQEIEKKRLEAKYRRERREIERKKLEALKKLEMKKLRVIKT